jgi:copper(I)-binding protein
MQTRIFTGLILSALLTASAQAADVTVTQGWFRALPPSVPSGGYFTLHNGGAKKITLSEVQSPACGMLMMHKSSNGGMAHVMTLDVAPGETLAFAPGGYHLMCMDAKLKPGATVPVTFTFSQGAKLAANFAVRSATGK